MLVRDDLPEFGADLIAAPDGRTCRRTVGGGLKTGSQLTATPINGVHCCRRKLYSG